MKKQLLILGGRSTAQEIGEVAEAYYAHEFDKITYVVGDDENVDGIRTWIRDSDLAAYVGAHSCGYILSFSNHGLRTRFEDIMGKLEVEPHNIIHPTALISKSARLGKGNYVAGGAVISSHAVVGNHCILNFGSQVGHDAQVGSHCILNPGARVSGNARIGDRVLIGSNSFIFQGIRVGNDCLIDALTYLDRDIGENQICSSRTLKVFKRVM